MSLNIPPLGPDIRVWANDVRRAVARAWDALTFKQSNVPATQNGVLLWDEANGYPVVAKDGVWRQVILSDGFANLGQPSTINAAAANTAYEVALVSVSAEGITLTGSPATDITFAEAGLYVIAFSAQITSTSSSAVKLRFWPRVNGVDIAGSTIVATMHSNGSTTVVARTGMFQMAAGDVLNVMWATDSTSAYLEAHAATAYAPASPSVTVGITRVKG